jgi:CheY-like chemotaxis protein
VDVHQTITEVLSDFGVERITKRINIQTELRAWDYQINADPIKLHQILSNLLGNALKFTPKGGLIEIATSNPSNDEIVIVIRDNGIGIQNVEQADLFAPFVQGRRAVRQGYGGLGLGLSICKKLVEAHGGSIAVYSAGLNQGTSFTLRFPCTDVKGDESLPRQVGGKLRPLSILLVEDHDDSRECLCQLLQMRGHEVISADTGEKARQFGQNCIFDLLITDLNLPDLNGLILLQELRETQPELEGIVLSGYAQPIDVAKSKEAGYLAHLCKPVSLPQLDEGMLKVFEKG